MTRDEATPALRAARVEELLRRAGMQARVDAVGAAADIAAVRVGLGELERVTSLAAEIRALGFRYVALDLTPGRD